MDEKFKEILDQYVSLQIQAEAALNYYKSLCSQLRELEGEIESQFVPEEVSEATGLGGATYELRTENKQISYVVLQRGVPDEHGGTFIVHRIPSW
ncbi:hypothetical protein [Leptolyngbya sp. FACHB-17]|uniref:hypothetical protein n=1 Tax=unclassified Leptolyngbya TaxID=2650499 RepID=UPI001680D9DE|nr:hypothetical protein [Leptolyngbya sp. FACHB-17]MBD2079218.1 hypothetical protein [Leptolyngbya sp. FACHB-17]